jgi:hypothetical protein
MDPQVLFKFLLKKAITQVQVFMDGTTFLL